MLAALGGIGIVGILIVILVVLAIVYFLRRAQGAGILLRGTAPSSGPKAAARQQDDGKEGSELCA